MTHTARRVFARRVVGAGLVALTLGAGAPGEARSSGGADTATIKGVVKFAGQMPINPTIDMRGEPACKNAYPAAPRDEAVLVNPNGTLANVLVYVKAGLPADAKYSPPPTPLVLSQVECMYRPRVFGLMVGQALEIANDDTLAHNVKTLGMLNRRFNIDQPGLTVSRSVYLTPVRALTDVVFGFRVPEVPVPFACSVHGWMHAYAGVFAHPFFAVTGTDGSFTLSGMPPGTYTIGAWQEKYGMREITVTVGAGETKTIDVSY